MRNHRLAIFASGTGTNTINIYRYFLDHPLVETALIISDNPGAGILTNPEIAPIPKLVWAKEQRKDRDYVLSCLHEYKISFLVLAGYLKLIPRFLIQAFPDKIVNIHPALLPDYGGKGMYGMNVHQAILDAGETKTGISIHYVNENYDEGKIVFQASCDISDCTKPEQIAARVHDLEYFYYPRIITQLLSRVED